MNIQTTKVALFGGSFDPPHEGHLAVMRHLLEVKLFKEVWLLPTFSHAFGKNLAPYAHRLAMLKECVQGLPVTLCEIEKEMQQTPSYTVDVLKELQKRHPAFEFYLVMGSDVAEKLDQWKDPSTLQKLARLYPLPRGGIPGSSFPDISSSMVRQKIRQNETIDELVPKSVAHYLQKYELYKT